MRLLRGTISVSERADVGKKRQLGEPSLLVKMQEKHGNEKKKSQVDFKKEKRIIPTTNIIL